MWRKPQANPWIGKRKLYKAFDKRHSLIKSKIHPSPQPSSWSHLMNHLILFSEPALGTELGEMLADIFPCQLAHSSLRPAFSAACRYAAPFPQRTRHLQARTRQRRFTVSACRCYLLCYDPLRHAPVATTRSVSLVILSKTAPVRFCI